MTNLQNITHCPGTLAPDYDTYSKNCLNQVFNSKKVHHVLDFDRLETEFSDQSVLTENHTRISISGVQEKYSLILDKNRLRFVNENEHGTHILKPIPFFGKNPEQMPANEHLTMQIAAQVYGIETAENAMIFFKNGSPAYIVKRFDFNDSGTKTAVEDFASLAGRTPQTHGANFKYLGSYLDLFELMKTYLPAYRIEAPKLLKLLVFNYLFSNGDAHFKNFSIIETNFGDFKLSPAYDLLNTRMHVDDSDFALENGLLPPSLSGGSIQEQFKKLAQLVGIAEAQTNTIINSFLSNTPAVIKLIESSFLKEQFKRNYLQAYQGKLKKLMK